MTKAYSFCLFLSLGLFTLRTSYHVLRNPGHIGSCSSKQPQLRSQTAVNTHCEGMCWLRMTLSLVSELSIGWF